MEDLLTSCVFDVLRTEPSGRGLTRWLRFAEPVCGYTDHGLPRDLDIVAVQFWPWLASANSPGAEPDVLIRAKDAAGTRHHVLVEAKYRSGKSSEADSECEHPTDQLAREWHNLVSNLAVGEHPHLVYLTADFGAPVAEIQAAQSEFASKRPRLDERYPLRCSWLSWRHLIPAFRGDPESVLRELAHLMDHLELGFFEGIHSLPRSSASEWRFLESLVSFNFPAPAATAAQWRFGS